MIINNSMERTQMKTLRQIYDDLIAAHADDRIFAITKEPK